MRQRALIPHRARVNARARSTTAHRMTLLARLLLRVAHGALEGGKEKAPIVDQPISVQR
jgi:hypothetical protein